MDFDRYARELEDKRRARATDTTTDTILDNPWGKPEFTISKYPMSKSPIPGYGVYNRVEGRIKQIETKKDWTRAEAFDHVIIKELPGDIRRQYNEQREQIREKKPFRIDNDARGRAMNFFITKDGSPEAINFFANWFAARGEILDGKRVPVERPQKITFAQKELIVEELGRRNLDREHHAAAKLAADQAYMRGYAYSSNPI